MSRTTLNLDDPVLEELRQLGEREGVPLGRLASDLLAEALAGRTRGTKKTRPAFFWASQPMGARVDLADREALYSLLDRSEPEAGS
ncbi:MAG TPA: antitoxin [Thermoanaerobaculia bacterium]|nr:antitoxin [Thermoanaerobaculia bacterium]